MTKVKNLEVRTKEQILAAIYAGQPVTISELKTLNIGLIEAFEASNMTEEGFRAVQIDKQLVRNYETNYLPIPLMILPAEELVATKQGFLLEVLRVNSEGKEEKIYKDNDYVKDGLKITLDESDIVVTAGRRRLSSLFTFGKKDTLVYFEVKNRAAVNMSNDAISINSASEFSKLWAALKQDPKTDIGLFLKTLNVKDKEGAGANKKSYMTKLVRLLQHLENSDSVKFSRITEQVFSDNFSYNALKNLLAFLTSEQRVELLGSDKDSDKAEYLSKVGELVCRWFDYCEGNKLPYGVTKSKVENFVKLELPAPPKTDEQGAVEKFSGIKPVAKIVIDAVASSEEEESLHGSVHKYIMSLPMTNENITKLGACYDAVKGAYKTGSEEYKEFLEGTAKMLQNKQVLKEKSIFNTIFKETIKEGAKDTELNSTFETWLKSLGEVEKELLLSAILGTVKKEKTTSAAVIDLNENF